MKQLNTISEAINHLYAGLLLQGIIFLSLSVMIVIFPQLLFALVSAMFFLAGIVFVALAYKVRMFWKKLPSFLK